MGRHKFGDQTILLPDKKVAGAGPEHTAKFPFSHQFPITLTRLSRTSIRPCKRWVQPFEWLRQFFGLLLGTYLFNLSYHLVAGEDAAIDYALRAPAAGWASYILM